MYTPSAFRPTNEQLKALMQATGLAVVVTHDEQGFEATHLPLLFQADEGPYGTLYGHFAKANPHWSRLRDAPENLVIFAGPDAYVSPSYYPSKAQHGRVVPTWNYVAVHAYGPAEIVEEPAQLRSMLAYLSSRHEQDRPVPWHLDDAPADYLDGLLKGIVGFRLTIARLEGQWKLSQNRSAEDRAGVRTGLASHPGHEDIVQHMTYL
ncbi:PaiB family negative transcriptional regulator [Pseudomonas duriflava]|uniref:PaiB family negative transcriptional regulator n=1 Tax=Pseudomonas duriflava TaxID=459528 RepID=A0A562PTN0_9PSED|nr:FMN-binding negative transcriptional regulator [Pseudomonas duriflava]TWI47791.1 PaiB family negative transcriptional regulator [Pseudomonas duriflava]